MPGDLAQLPCCPDDGLCRSCADYRSYLNDVRYREPVYRPPEGFAHTPYKATAHGIKAAEVKAAAKEAKRHG